MKHLECAKPARNQWYLYLLVLFLCLIVSNTIGSIPHMLIVLSSILKNGFDMEVFLSLLQMDASATDIDLNLILVAMSFPFVVILITAVLLIPFFHQRSWKEVINGTNRVRWSRFFFGMLVWGLISLVLFAIGYFTEPELIKFRFEPLNFFILLVISLIFVPIQASSEEFLFRGYLTQGVASWTKSRWWALIIPSILFGLLHSDNPEIKEYGFLVMMPHYIFPGLLFGLMTILDDGIELAMGVHTINNLFGATLVTYKGSALQTYALFELTEINPAEDLLPLVVSGIALLAIFAAKYKWNFRILNQKVEM